MNANAVAAEEPLGRCPEVFDSWGSSWEVKRGGGEVKKFGVFCGAGRLEHHSAMAMEQRWRMQLCQADGAGSHPSMKSGVLLRTPCRP